MKGRWALVCALVAAAVVVAAANLALAEEPQPQAQGEVVAQAMLGSAFTYQGRLTDGGAPANGVYDFQFKLYDAESEGSQVGGTRNAPDVTVTNGLFTVSLDFGPAPFNGRALWLEVGVRPGSSDGDFTILAPRTALNAAPYALGLMPGTDVVGSVDNAPMFSATNSGSGIAVGLWGQSTNAAGVYGQSSTSIGVSGVGAIGVQGYATGSGVALKAYGNGVIQSSARSYLWIAGNEARVSTDQLDKVDVIYGWSGSSLVRATTAGSYDVMIPISLPTVLYGQNVKVSEVLVYYSVENAGDKIDLTQLRKNTGAGTADTVVDDGTDRNSTTAIYYALPLSEPISLSDTSGHLSLRLLVNFTGTGASRDIAIGGVRLTLKHE